MRGAVQLLICLLPFLITAQQAENQRSITVATKDSIKIDSLSINPSYFKVATKSGIVLDSTNFKVDYSKAVLILNRPFQEDSLVITYRRFPQFLTKKYSILSEDVIIPNTDNLNKLLKLSQPTLKSEYAPFDGLTTSGSISRGVTIGNNQNSVLNSELDLQIAGKLSEKVTLRASIQDANIPLQEAGYTQRLDEFDQVFIEIFSDDWNIRAGDIDLINDNSYFANFNKRVQGLLVNATLNHPGSQTNLFASGALVRGQFTTSKFTAQEGNQGPYKLVGPNNELFVIIVSGSETVYVNGVAIERGETEDYIIDYNAGEIIFNPTFPITSEMRITVDYQFSDRNYSRFTAFGGGNFHSENLKLGVSVYSESDAKNQPLQQNLSSEQVEILAAAGDDSSLMFAPSGIEEEFSENRILYRKVLVNGVEVFEFSNDPEEDLFSVNFSLVGDGEGDYIIASTQAVRTIYEYIPPINGVPQGNYAPIIQLISPDRLQIAVMNGEYSPTATTNVQFEVAGSKKDENLFSSLDDEDNDGFAGRLNVEQQIFQKDSLNSLVAFANMDFLHDNFESIQRIYYAEFNRDWNLLNPEGNQLLATAGLQFRNLNNGLINYTFQHLNFSENFNGNKHNLLGNYRLGRSSIFTNSSILKSESDISNTRFARSFNRLVQGFGKQWVGGRYAMEDNRVELKESQELTNLSQRFQSYEVFTGIGDSLSVFGEIGYKYRVNDSLRNNQVQRVNHSNSVYLKTKLIQNEFTNLGLFVNYRKLKWENEQTEDENSLNSRLTYNQRFLDNLLLWNTIYETSSGTLPQQDFTYVQVEPGRGNYTWNDYNENGIQELNEFEVAQFQDEGRFIRVLLPNRVFVKTHQNSFSQSLTINPQQWATSEDAMKKLWSHFYNQTSFLINRKYRREGNNFNLNPANDDGESLAQNKSIRNSLFYNRSKQRYSTTYTYLNNENRTLLSIGFQQNSLQSHQLNFNHKILDQWLITFEGFVQTNESQSENFANRNFRLDEESLQPKLSYLFGDNARIDAFYEYTSKQNVIGNEERLLQNRYGVGFNYNSAQQLSLIGEVNYFRNDFSGNSNSPVAYQMLEGLQPGSNFTWSLLAQKKLTKFLDLNLNYLGRKTETSRTIHTGTIQLKAYF